MRIISNFQDYYDGIANIGGHDKSIVYQRHTDKKLYYDNKMIKFPCKKAPNNQDYCTHLYLFFCGKLYFCNNCRGYFCKKTHSFIKTNPDYKWNDLSTLKVSSHFKSDLYEFQNELNKDWTSFNLEYSSPIILIEDTRNNYNDFSLTINPKLIDIKFGSFMDSYTAYQTLEGFVDTHFIRKVDMTEIAPMVRFEKKGFCKKTSFRKEKSL